MTHIKQGTECSVLRFVMLKINVVSVYTKIPRLFNLLQSSIPAITFKQIMSTNDKELHQSEVLVIDLPLLLPILYDIPNTKFIQITKAGVDELINQVRQNKRSPSCPIVRYTGPMYANLMAEYVIHQIIDYERDFERLRSSQKAKVWSSAGRIRTYRTISDLKIGLLGVGHLGVGIAKICYSLGATLYGFRRMSGELPNIYKDIFRGKDRLPEFLRLCDYVVSILPETEDTKGLLNNGVLKHCKEKNAIFINVGRGSVISEQELVHALENKWIQAAFLDVLPIEPLFKHSALWTMPGVSITPHVAAYNRAEDIVKMFKINLELLQRNKPLVGVIDFERGY